MAESKRPNPLEWVKINRHMQSIGTATCDVSNLIMQASGFGEGTAARFVLMSAARDVLSERRRARRGRSELAALKQKRVKVGGGVGEPRLVGTR